MDTAILRSTQLKTMSKALDENPKPTDFENFVPWACEKFNMINVNIIIRSIQKKYSVSTSAKSQKAKVKRPSLVLIPTRVDSADYMKNILSTSDNDESANGETIVIEAYYDIHDNLVQLKFANNKSIPRKIMQVIALTIPFQKYLTSITINSGLSKEVLYEISELLPISQITELCLDYTFISEANYHVVVSSNKLKHLSLAKCKINDTVVKLICEQLTIPSPTTKVLSALNLSSNRITDDGAKYIAALLRVNRQLSYLNLANNMITDAGGLSILNVLKKFPLYASELIESRAKHVVYLKQKKELIDTIMIELQDSRKPDKTLQTKKMAKKINEIEKTPAIIDTQILQNRAQYTAESKIGLFCDPFSANNTETIDTVVHCLGNNSLCCLNLAYNSLSYVSLKRLHEVLSTQKTLNRTPKGLIKVVIEGNLLPVACPEYENINNLLGNKTTGKFDDSESKKKRSFKK